jgi:hypothetical protein
LFASEVPKEGVSLSYAPMGLPWAVKNLALTQTFDTLFLFLKDRFAPSWLVQLGQEVRG